MSTCLFCRIVAGEIPSTVVYQDEHLFAFRDVNPQAPAHVLIVPKRHVATLNDLTAADDGLVGEMVRRSGLIARELGHADSGYRTVFNCNAAAGQTVFHVHLHLLAGRNLGWPPG